jgi:glycosyltransferase involved in cell wall biosynthesis
MKIALIGTTAGCVLNFRSELIEALVSQGHLVYVFAIDYDGKSSNLVEKMGAIPVLYRLERTGINPFVDIANTFRLSRQLRALDLDLVFSYFSKPVVFGTFAAVIARIKRRIGMLEGLGYFFSPYPSGDKLKIKIVRYILVLLYRLSFPFLERIIFLNPDDKEDLLIHYNINVKSVSILGGIGVNLNNYPYSPPKISQVSFIFVGRFLAEKGIHEFIAAARKIKEKYPLVDFYMLGGLDEENPGGLTALELSRLTQSGVVHHAGHVEDVLPWLKKSSVFVLPSHREGVPRSTQEALAVGRPVITTDVPGCRETVLDGINGFLVEPLSPDDLVNKMEKFIKSPELIIQMGRESRRLAQEKFDSVKVNKKLVSYFEH